MKKSIFRFSFALGLMFFSFSGFAMEGNSNEESRVPPLKKLTAQCIFKTLEQEAEENAYGKIIDLRNPELFHNDIQELIFPSYYEPKRDQLNFTFMGFMATVNLMECDLGNKLSHNPHLLDPLAESSYLKSLDVGNNDLGGRASYLSPLTNLTSLNVECNDLGEHVSSLCHLTNLRTLDMQGNNIDQLTGEATVYY